MQSSFKGGLNWSFGLLTFCRERLVLNYYQKVTYILDHSVQENLTGRTILCPWELKMGSKIPMKAVAT